ncbi:MAG: PASTA domain-containing protein [Proteobacteria bacterium]|nr:PASTA domain-containing protein [Pseudomonadota bacterium]MBU1060301.1 PASTA domain-containing protein [Pseudomonadota bacterium]
MVRRSRLRTENNRRRLLRALLVLLVLGGVVAGIAFVFRQQLRILSAVWEETFPANEFLVEESVRGTIYDRNFKELAETLERVSLYARPREVENLEGTAGQLSGVLGISEPELKQRLGRDSHLVWLRRDIGQGEEEEIHRLGLPGIYLHRELARKYPEQAMGAHLVGYAENDLGLAGIEHYYDHLLSHDHVRQEAIPNVDLKGEEETSGYSHDLVLTVDMKIQAILDKYVADLGENLGRVQLGSLLLETGEGKIIAGVNFPSYNPNTIWQYENEVLENILLTPLVIPKEIRQFFLEASLLQRGWEQGTQIYPWSLVAGKTDFAGQLRLWDRLQLTTELNVDLSGGKKGSSSIPEFIDCGPVADLGTVPKIAPPLKVVLGFTHLLNGGKKIQPHFLDRVLERPSQKEYVYDVFRGKTRGTNVLPSLVSAELRTLLRAQGTPGILGSVAISGETLSRIALPTGYEYVRDRMSLVVIPAEKPEIILLLVSRQKDLGPRKVDDSNPDFLCKTIDTILPSMVALQQVSYGLAGLVEAAEKKNENFQSEGMDERNVSKNLAGMLKEQTRIMPDLTGLSLRRALRLLQGTEVEVHVEGSGRIRSQSPEAGGALKTGGQCRLILKKDTAPKETVEMSNLENDSKQE